MWRAISTAWSIPIPEEKIIRIRRFWRGCSAEMSQYMSYELHAFARAFFHGAALCWIYDGLTVWRLARKSGRVAVDLRDLLFWIFAALVTFRYFYTVSSGSLRGYLFVGIVLGSLAWKYSLSSYYVKAGTVVLKFLGKVWNIPAKVLKKIGKKVEI